jgi:hypothetical protein
MLDKYASFAAWFVSQMRTIARGLTTVSADKPASTMLTEENTASLRDRINIKLSRGWCEKLELEHTLAYLATVEERFESKTISFADAIGITTQLADRVQDELKKCWFVYVPKDYIKRYQEPLEGWGTEIKSNLPSAIFDIAEASRCLAINRPTATVFHAMRVLEVGIVCLATKLRIPRNKRDKSWGTVLDAVQGEIDRKFPSKGMSTHKRKQRRIYSGMIAQFNVFQRAWRDYTIHNPVRYQRGGAVEILDAVRAFIRSIQEAGLKEKRKRPKAIAKP